MTAAAKVELFLECTEMDEENIFTKRFVDCVKKEHDDRSSEVSLIFKLAYVNDFPCHSPTFHFEQCKW